MVHMPRLINARTLLDMVVIGVNAVMEDSGPKGLTLRGIARELRGSPSTLLHHYGNLDELLRLAAWETADDRIRDIEASTRSSRHERGWDGRNSRAHTTAMLPRSQMSARRSAP